MRISIAVLFVLHAVQQIQDVPCVAQDTGAIWGASILPQPFEKAAFQEIRIPEWLQKTTGSGYTLSVMSSEDRRRAASHGVQLSELGFVDPFYAYYDSQLLKRRNPSVSPDQLDRDIAEYQRLGVRIVGVYPPCLQAEVWETHPDWRRIATNITTIPEVDLQQQPYGGMLCLLGPYGDFFIEVLAEILTNFPEVHAFSFDGLHYAGVCYCEHCRAAYRDEAGLEIPDANMEDLAFRRYQHWADRRMENLVQRMQVRLKGINPQVALVTWSTNAGRFGHFLSIPRNMPARMNLLLDAPDQEFWMDESNRGGTIVPAFANAYVWAVTNHRVAFSEPYLMTHGNPYGKDSFPSGEVMRRMLLAVTYGAQPSIAVSQPGNLQSAVNDGLDRIAKLKPWLTHKRPESWAAILMSDNTRNFYGRSAGHVEERYLAHVFGTFRAAMEEHLQFELINDWNLTSEDLQKYKVLVLPNAACLDLRQVAAIRDFVQSGGGLVAGLDASRFDEFGEPRGNFALADVFGVDYAGPPRMAESNEEIDVNFAAAIGPDYWEKRKNIFDFALSDTSPLNRDRMSHYVNDQPVTFKGSAVRVEPHPHTMSWGSIGTKGNIHQNEMPAIVASQYGSGRVVYFASGLDAAYYLYSYPYQRLAMKHAIDWASSQPQSVSVTAPMCVHATVMRQCVPSVQTESEEQRLLVHLFNDLNTTAGHALPVDDVPLREETIPIHDIAIDFSSEYQFSRVHLEPAGLELAQEKLANGKSRIVVPKLEIHAIVVGELKPLR